MQRDSHYAGDSNAPEREREPARPVVEGVASRVIVNADDWGLAAEVTARTLDCFRAGVLSSVGAMVFMDASEAAAAAAREHGMDAGVHLNLTTAFTGARVPAGLRNHQEKVIAYLRRRRIHRVLFNPLLKQSFEYVVKAQLDEFVRLYGTAPSHLNGHHHMHLCANVLRQKLLPAGSVVRRSKSFFPEERNLANRCLREIQNRWLRRRHRTTDYFFDLTPVQEERLTRILALAESHSLEIAVHADNPGEYGFLMGGQLERYTTRVTIARGYRLRCAAGEADRA